MKKILLLFVMTIYSLSFAQLDIQKISTYLGQSPEQFIKDYKLTEVKKEDNFGEIKVSYKGFIVDGLDYVPQVVSENGKIKEFTFYREKDYKTFFASTASELDKLETTYRSFLTSKT